MKSECRYRTRYFPVILSASGVAPAIPTFWGEAERDPSTRPIILKRMIDLAQDDIDKRAGLCRVVLDFDAKGLKEFQILITDLKLGIAGEGCDH